VRHFTLVFQFLLSFPSKMPNNRPSPDLRRYFQTIMEKKMKKVLVAVLLSGFAMSASAGLSKSCEAYFAEIDSFVSAAPAAQQAMLKQQYDASKQQLSALPEAAQEQACSQATEQLKQVKAAMGK